MNESHILFEAGLQDIRLCAVRCGSVLIFLSAGRSDPLFSRRRGANRIYLRHRLVPFTGRSPSGRIDQIFRRLAPEAGSLDRDQRRWGEVGLCRNKRTVQPCGCVRGARCESATNRNSIRFFCTIHQAEGSLIDTAEVLGMMFTTPTIFRGQNPPAPPSSHTPADSRSPGSHPSRNPARNADARASTRRPAAAIHPARCKTPPCRA